MTRKRDSFDVFDVFDVVPIVEVGGNSRTPLPAIRNPQSAVGSRQSPANGMRPRQGARHARSASHDVPDFSSSFRRPSRSVTPSLFSLVFVARLHRLCAARPQAHRPPRAMFAPRRSCTPRGAIRKSRA
ncbi:hypothetical protein WS62_09465 [Burkholderia sp. ABCPW 14]|nr:hypothetical protein WS62_09465 [Burkholderia sp. ABCPW 14]